VEVVEEGVATGTFPQQETEGINTGAPGEMSLGSGSGALEPPVETFQEDVGEGTFTFQEQDCPRSSEHGVSSGCSGFWPGERSRQENSERRTARFLEDKSK
jgi:hypothetical protein